MSKNTYIPGDWNLICDSCGKKIKASLSKHRWDGFIVCESCYEPRHPQDFIRAKTDKIVVPFSRPKSTDIFDTQFGVFDPIEIQDSLQYIVDYQREFADTVGLTDSIVIIRTFTFADSTELTDSVSITIEKGLTDTVSMTETIVKSIEKGFTDSVALYDTIEIIFTIVNADTVELTDTGIVYTPPYTNEDYFLEDYNQTSFTF